MAAATPDEWGDEQPNFGEAALKIALKKGSFNVARFLIEVMKVKADSFDLAQVVSPELTVNPLNQSRWNKLRQMIADGQHLLQADDPLYWNERIKCALEQDDADELQYLAQVNRRLLLSYSEGGREICQRAAQVGAKHCLQYLLTLIPDQRHIGDEEGNSLVHLAVAAEKLEVVQFLLSDSLYCAGGDFNNKGQSVFATAQLLGNKALITLLFQQYDPRTLDVLPCGLSLSSFKEGAELSVKGLALMLHYYAQKNPEDSSLFLVQDQGVKELARIFDFFVRGTTENLLLYYDTGAHRLVYKCEKFQGRPFVVVLDSLSLWGEKHAVLEEMKTNYPQSLDKLTFCVNQTRQQTAGVGCQYYALKNLSILMKTPFFYAELDSGRYFIKTIIQNEAEIRDFFLPARFMHLTTSPKQLADYIKDHPKEASKALRKTKEGVWQNLESYCLHQRNCHGMKTPERVKNLKFDPDDEESKEEEYILKSNTLWYFRNKYINVVVPLLVNELPQETLASLLLYYNASNLLLDPQTKHLFNQRVIRSRESGNTFFYRPRLPSVDVSASDDQALSIKTH